MLLPEVSRNADGDVEKSWSSNYTLPVDLKETKKGCGWSGLELTLRHLLVAACCPGNSSQL